jgi:hypothetical protein
VANFVLLGHDAASPITQFRRGVVPQKNEELVLLEGEVQTIHLDLIASPFGIQEIRNFVSLFVCLSVL